MPGQKSMTDITFKYGTLIRTGPKLVNGGKWDAELNDDVRNSRTNADLTISIAVHFDKINPARGTRGTYGDWDDKPTHPSKRRIQAWKVGEFEHFKRRMLSSAQRYWSGKFWLRTPSDYDGLDYDDVHASYRCNLYCRLELTDSLSAGRPTIPSRWCGWPTTRSFAPTRSSTRRRTSTRKT